MAWLRIPAEILGKVTPTAALVYAVIADAGNMGPVQLSAAQIAQRAGCTDRHARRCIDELLRASYLAERLTGTVRELTPAPLMEPKRRHDVKPVRGARPLRRESSLGPIEELEAIMNEQIDGQHTFTGEVVGYGKG